ncbi:hypothetical protein A9G22_00615 [Gilliamella sp. App2-1]|nr:hypothetical protein A9G22_00615 [Gilliamella apicola]
MQVQHNLLINKIIFIKFKLSRIFDEVIWLAIPVYDKNGKVIAAIIISGGRFQMPNERISEFGQYLLAATKMLSDKIRS